MTYFLHLYYPLHTLPHKFSWLKSLNGLNKQGTSVLRQASDPRDLTSISHDERVSANPTVTDHWISKSSRYRWHFTKPNRSNNVLLRTKIHPIWSHLVLSNSKVSSCPFVNPGTLKYFHNNFVEDIIWISSVETGYFVKQNLSVTFISNSRIEIQVSFWWKT